jgi:non-ribosomal peptide synthetase component F
MTFFRNRSARTPDAVAVSCGDRELTYRELDDRSNQLAQELREASHRPETLVAVFFAAELRQAPTPGNNK